MATSKTFPMGPPCALRLAKAGNPIPGGLYKKPPTAKRNPAYTGTVSDADESQTDGEQRGKDDSNDANAERKASATDASTSATSAVSSGFSWESFLSDYADEISGLESSRTAKKFVRKAEKADKKGPSYLLVDASQFNPSAFVMPPNQSNSSSSRASGSSVGHGPRDFETSWLDIDDVLERRGGFTPPKPHIPRSSMTTVAMTFLLVLGVFGVVVSIMAPTLSWWLRIISGVLLVLGITGLIDTFCLHRH